MTAPLLRLSRSQTARRPASTGQAGRCHSVSHACRAYEAVTGQQCHRYGPLSQHVRRRHTLRRAHDCDQPAGEYIIPAGGVDSLVLIVGLVAGREPLARSTLGRGDINGRHLVGDFLAIILRRLRAHQGRQIEPFVSLDIVDFTALAG